METDNRNCNGESKIRKVLFNEISFMVAGIGLISSVIFWVVNPQQDMKLDMVRMQTQMESNQSIATELEKIKNNDLHELELRLDQIETRQIEMMKSLARIEALHNK